MIEKKVQTLNTYLKEHPKAKLETALGKVQEKIKQLQVHKWLQVQGEGRTLVLQVDQEALETESRLDGCDSNGSA